MQEVNAWIPNDSLPAEVTRDIQIFYSDSGRIQAMLKSPRMIRYEDSDPRTVFPDGIFVIFYDKEKAVRSDLKANHAISRDETNVMEAQGDVEVNNYEKQEKINTEHMIWDQKAHTISSEVFVKITTPDKILYGDEGFEADEWLNKWVIKKPRGSFEIEEEAE